MPDEDHIFISYARRDGEENADRLDKALLHHSFRTWRDTRELDPARDFTAELEKAIKNCSCVIACITPDTARDDSFVRREIQYALDHKKPVIIAQCDINTLPPINISTLTRIEFYEDWDKAFRKLLNAIEKSVTKRSQPPTPLELSDPFRPYLERLHVGIIEFFDRFVISFIELKSESTPEALPKQLFKTDMLEQFFFGQGIDEQPDKQIAFSSIGEAFEHYNSRILLLGEPGAGKTTTIMRQAYEAVLKRLSDIKAPLPLLGLISTWDADEQTSIAGWLAEGYQELDITNVQHEINQGNALLLLDGLDELGAERTKIEVDTTTENPDPSKIKLERYDPRQRFLRIIPSNNQAIVTCRVQDYKEIGQKVALNGAVTLKRLDDTQLQFYLAEQPDLLVAAQTDGDLKNILTTPLLLRFFAFAYRDKGEEARKLQNLRNSPGELRDEIIGRYITRRYEWEERKHKLVFNLEKIKPILQSLAFRDALNLKKNVISLKDFAHVLPESEVRPFVELCERLHLIVSSDYKTFRFIHLLVRDYFAFDPLIEALRYSDKRISSRAAEILGNLRDERALSPISNALQHGSNYAVRSAAAFAMGQIRSGRAIRQLTLALTDEFPVVRSSAAHALGRFATPRSMDALIATLSDEEDSVREAASDSLIQIGSLAISPLLLALNNRDEDVRCRICIALGQIGNRRATRPLISALNDKHWRVRSHAAEALGQIGNKIALPALNKATSDKDGRVSSNAKKAIEKIEGKAILATTGIKPLIVSLKSLDEAIRIDALEKLVKVGEPAVRHLIKAINADDLILRYYGALALGAIKDERAVKALKTLLRDIRRPKKHHKRICDIAAKSLLQIGTKEAEDAVDLWKWEIGYY